jgi:hypothetical protein
LKKKIVFSTDYERWELEEKVRFSLVYGRSANPTGHVIRERERGM